MDYLKKHKKWTGLLLFTAICYNLYFIYLLRDQHVQKLLYLDLLLFTTLCCLLGADAMRHYHWLKKKQTLLSSPHVICRELKAGENLDVAYHDTAILEEQLRRQYDAEYNLQDYIARWFHEVKIPLSACLLMNEKITDVSLRTSQKEQLEKIRQQLNSALLGCKVQSRLSDIQIRAVSLDSCVKTSIHNNQYFLIQNQFEIRLSAQSHQIYTDPSWFTYVLDQLIQNAIKYAGSHPVLDIQSMEDAAEIRLIVTDNGEGIPECDIRRIFERGYTGSSHHNGKYKSTGMGLYMAAQILEKLGHEITVESTYGSFTRFTIHIYKHLPDPDAYFGTSLQKM